MTLALRFLNECLTLVGEMPVDTYQSLNGIRGLVACRNALFEICTLATWPWVRDEVVAEEWRHNIAYLPRDTHRILDVSANNYPLTPLSSQEIRTIYSEWDKGYTGSDGFSKYYCAEEEDDGRFGVIILPYPTDAQGQKTVKFRRSRIIQWPEYDNATVPVPMAFEPLLQAKVMHNIAVAVGAEANIIEAHAQEYERLAKRLRTTLSQRSGTGTNMYRRQRR